MSVLIFKRMRIRCWKNLHRLSERLASLGTMGTQLRAPLKALNTIVLRNFEEFQGGHRLDPDGVKKRQSLRQLGV